MRKTWKVCTKVRFLCKGFNFVNQCLGRRVHIRLPFETIFKRSLKITDINSICQHISNRNIARVKLLYNIKLKLR